MFEKVLLSDDLVSINQGVFATISKLGITNIKQVQYCDDAYIRIKKAAIDGEPFDLLITDLSFQADHREQSFASGEELIIVLKKEFPKLKIIAFSVEERLQKIRNLMHLHHTDGYVGKGRKGLVELTEAVTRIYQGGTYLSPHLEDALNNKSDLELDDFELDLLKFLSHGMSQDDISLHLKKKNIAPNSISSVEKKVNKLRIQFKANNACHLISIVKDMGII